MDDIPRGLEKEYKLLAKWIFLTSKTYCLTLFLSTSLAWKHNPFHRCSSSQGVCFVKFRGMKGLDRDELIMLCITKNSSVWPLALNSLDTKFGLSIIWLLVCWKISGWNCGPRDTSISCFNGLSLRSVLCSFWCRYIIGDTNSESVDSRCHYLRFPAVEGSS